MKSDTIEIIKTELIVDDFIYVFQKKVVDGLRFTYNQRKEYCKDRVTTNKYKTKIIKYKQHSYNLDSAKSEVYCTLNEIKIKYYKQF